MKRIRAKHEDLNPIIVCDDQTAGTHNHYKVIGPNAGNTPTFLDIKFQQSSEVHDGVQMEDLIEVLLHRVGSLLDNGIQKEANAAVYNHLLAAQVALYARRNAEYDPL